MDTTSFTIPRLQENNVPDNKNDEIHEVKSIENLKHDILDKLSRKGSGGFWIWWVNGFVMITEFLFKNIWMYIILWNILVRE